METACLRIKFTPLLQNIQKEDSKHCLEIVPEITCIQNLDKIQWKKAENSIEYTIPMTYKIILRKKHVIEVNKERLDKTYHSCVDLLLPSSDTNFIALGSGDISRIVSDTFVLSKVTTDVEKCNILLKQASVENRNIESVQVMTAQVQTEGNCNTISCDQLDNNEITKSSNYKSLEIATTQTSRQVFQSESHVIQVVNDNIVNYIKKSIDTITNTEVSAKANDEATSLEEVNQMLPINSKTETKPNLSLTPICSINTDDKQTEKARRVASNMILYLRYETQKEYAIGNDVRNTIKYDDLYFHVNKTNNTFCKAMQYNCVTSHRVRPEVRVANFVQIMEREIMPLKLMLSDIISKCSSLGFSWKESQRSPLIYKNVPYCEKQISECIKTQKQSKSNRVVYSVVFDG